MINANLSQFLDTCWFIEATLYYKGYTYWCQVVQYHNNEKPMYFFIHRYRSVIHRDGDKIWTPRLVENGGVVDYEDTYFEAWGYGEDDVKEQFLKAKIFDGKSFWKVEKELAWYDEDQLSFIKFKEVCLCQ